MSYLSPGEARISREALQLLAQLVRMPMPREDVHALAAALTGQLAAIEQIDRLDLEDIQPALGFDPRWDD